MVFNILENVNKIEICKGLTERFVGRILSTPDRLMQNRLEIVFMKKENQSDQMIAA